MSDEIYTYLNCLNNYPGVYVKEKTALDLIATYNYSLDFDELLEKYPEDTRAGKLIKKYLDTNVAM